MDRNQYPTGWNKQRVQEVIDHLETRTEEETIAEDEAAFEQDYTAMQVPRKLNLPDEVGIGNLRSSS